MDSCFVSIATALSPYTASHIYAIRKPDRPVKEKKGVEVLSSNDAIQFVDGSNGYATVIGLESSDFIANLALIGNRIAQGARIFFNVRIDGSAADFRAVTAAKDVGAIELISASAVRKPLDIFVAANWLMVGGAKCVIHFYRDFGAADVVYPYGDSLVKKFEKHAAHATTDVEDALTATRRICGTSYPVVDEWATGWPQRPAKAEQAVIFLGDSGPFEDAVKSAGAHAAVLNIRAYRPFPQAAIRAALARMPALKTVQVVQQTALNVQFPALLLDMADIVAGMNGVTFVSSQVGDLRAAGNAVAQRAVESLLANGRLATPVQNATFGATETGKPVKAGKEDASDDSAYLRILQEVGDVQVINSASATPEYALGQLLEFQHRQRRLADLVEEKIPRFAGGLQAELRDWLSWVRGADAAGAEGAVRDSKISGAELVDSLHHSHRDEAAQLLEYARYFDTRTRWIVGSDRWSYDAGLAAFHAALRQADHHAKLLIIDTDSSINRHQGKKNLGLYALNYGGSYVASVALYSSYTQTLSALIEANKFSAGPAVVLAYSPEAAGALDALRLTRKAVNTGYWPLYRYTPTADEGSAGGATIADNFHLDSSFLRRELRDFLDRRNTLTQLAAADAQLAYNLTTYNAAQQQRAASVSRTAYSELIAGLGSEPMTVAYASDNGNATGVARRIAADANQRGFKSKLCALDELAVDELSACALLIAVVSTSGQGEFPTGGKEFWPALKKRKEALTGLRYAVFGLGDSKYWPRAEDAVYFARPSAQLDEKLSALGAAQVIARGVGDDQAADGFHTALNAWVPALWKALGAENAGGADQAGEPAALTNEDMKRDSNYLRGTISAGLANLSTGAMTAADQQLTKFHGVYLQDDRDVREQRQNEGLEPAYAFMIRVRLAGCVTTPQQWLCIDRLASERGNGTFKITTRGTYQLHGVVKANLIPAVREINRVAMDTLGACGDVCRNVTCTACPTMRGVHTQLTRMARLVSRALLPETLAYHEIFLTKLGPVARGEESGPRRPAGWAEMWGKKSAEGGAGADKDADAGANAAVDASDAGKKYAEGGASKGSAGSAGKKHASHKKTKILVAGSPIHDLAEKEITEEVQRQQAAPGIDPVEPLYGATYLPRKFKVGITVPPYNDVDVYTNDVGLIAIVEHGKVIGFNVLAGGGMGTTHNNTKTYPRAGTPLGFIPYDKAPFVCQKFLIIERDYGDRKNRKHARLKYTLDDMGLDVFKERAEKLMGFKFQPVRPFKLLSNRDHYGWCKDEEGFNHYTVYVENGRIANRLGSPLKTGMEKVCQYLIDHKVGILTLTSNQHVILTDIPDSHVGAIKTLLATYKLDRGDRISGLRMASQSCVAFPTCGLAMAEAERFLPQFLDKLEALLDEIGLRSDEIVLRMTGCPNGCARPWLAEVALVGKSYGFYNLLLGGSFNGDRVNKLYKTNVSAQQALDILMPLFAKWAGERQKGEHFGDYCIRSGVIKPTLEGKHFWDDLNADIVA